MEKVRDYKLDLLRICAGFMVIFMHVACQYIYEGNIQSFNWQIYNIYDSLVRCCVPIFIMISGALLLDRDMTLKKIFKKYVLKIVILYIIFSFLYGIFNFARLEGISSFRLENASTIIKYIIEGNEHLWYLPMLLGLYLITPFLRKMVKENDMSMLKYAFILFISLSIFQTIKYIPFIPEPVCMIIDKLPLGIILQYYSFYILGYYLMKSQGLKEKRKIFYVLGVLSVVACIVLTYGVSLYKNVPTFNFYEYFSIFSILEAIGLFLFFRYNKGIEKISNKASKIIQVISPCLLGIYLIHIFFIKILKVLHIDIRLFNPIFSIPLISILVFIISFVAIYVIRKLWNVISQKFMKTNINE